MKASFLIALFSVLVMIGACNASATKEKVDHVKIEPAPHETADIIDTSGQTVQTRYNTPQGFSRVEIETNSFGAHLRNLKLKPHGSKVQYYDGTFKENYQVYAGVVDLPIGKRDLHQCADAIMRLRADYLRKENRFDEIHFQFNNGFEANYGKWKKGYRIHYTGSKFYWSKDKEPSNSDKSYWKYLEYVFSFAGTYSLAQELPSVPEDEMEIGDVFLFGGNPGHGVIVIDMAVNEETGEKCFMLAQSYMPAQEIQILINPNDSELSPWYNLNYGENLKTPEWQFRKGSLKRF